VFFVDICFSSILSYDREDGVQTIREHNVIKTVVNYFGGRFYLDFIPIIPLQRLEMINKRNMLFYLVKLMRLNKGFDILHVPTLMSKIKIIYKERSVKRIEEDPRIGNDKMNDNNKIQEVLLINYGIKITKMVIVILNFSYLLGMFWYIMCKLVEDFGGDDYLEESHRI
jgi:hypothetical protein